MVLAGLVVFLRKNIMHDGNVNIFSLKAPATRIIRVYSGWSSTQVDIFPLSGYLSQVK